MARFCIFLNNIKLLKTKNKKTYKNKKQKDNAGDTAVGISDADVAHIRAMTDTLCEAEGMELVFVEFHREAAGRILRVYIDKPGGVGINDCTMISRQLGDLLDVYLDSDVSYNLEVSSPGPERPLWKFSDFERFSGCDVKIKMQESLDGRKKFYGKLAGIEDGIVKLESKGEIIEIPHKNISQARLVNHDGENKC